MSISSLEVKPSNLFAVSILGFFATVGCMMALSLSGCSVLEEAGLGEAAPVVSASTNRSSKTHIDTSPTSVPSSGTARDKKLATRAPAPTAGAAPAESAAAANSRPLAALTQFKDEPEIRVRLLASATRLEVGVARQTGSGTARAGAIRVRPWVESSVQHAPDRRLRAPISVKVEVDGWLVTDSLGDTLRIDGSDLEVSSWEAEGAADLRVNGANYPGRLRLVARTDVGPSAFDCIEYVALESYLPGVVEREMYRGWPAAAYEIQAVCARSYALHEIARAAVMGKRFDVESTTKDQAYSGSAAHDESVRAVDATRGMVLTHHQTIIRAYYSSTCGGRPASAQDTWPAGQGFEYNGAPPLQCGSREWACESSPMFDWVVRRDAGDLAVRFREYGRRQGMAIRNVSDVAAITVDALASSGRPLRYKIAQADGRWYTLRAEDMRLACNQSAPGATELTRGDRVSSSDVTFEVHNGLVEISGRGFGHGVGMCQFCARGLAEKGRDWRSMAAVFYPGAHVDLAYR